MATAPRERVDAPPEHRTVIPLGVQSPKRSSSLPAARCPKTPWSRRAVSRRLFGLAPTGVCRATSIAECAVGSYPTLSPLPPCLPRGTHRGGLFSVALSVTCRSRRMRPGVTWQSTLWSPDFPRDTAPWQNQVTASRDRPADDKSPPAIYHPPRQSFAPPPSASSPASTRRHSPVSSGAISTRQNDGQVTGIHMLTAVQRPTGSMLPH